MRFVLLIATAVILSASITPIATETASADSTTFFVDCSAQRAGDGTRTKPWNALSAIEGHGAYDPGERILLKRGTTCRGLLRTTGSGTRGRPIVLGAWGSGDRPTVAGGGTPKLTGAMDLRNQAYWTIQDLRVTNTSGGTSTQTYRSGVSIRNQDGGQLPGLIVQRLVVENVASAPNESGGSSREWGGITVAAGGVRGDAFPGLVIRDNVVDHVGRSGIMVANWEYPATFNEHIRISGNRVSWSRGDGIVVFGARWSRIDNNVVDHASHQWPCPLCGGITSNTANAGIWPARSTDIQIDHNEVYGTFEKGGDGEGFDVDQSTERIAFEYNYAHDNQGGGILFCGSNEATVRFNIFENNRRAAFNFIEHAPAPNTKIYNNTVFTRRIEGTSAVRTVGGGNSTDVSFFNNLVENHSDGLWDWPSKAVRTEANTLIGNNGAGAPDDGSTSRKNAGLRDPGSGGIGFHTLDGYRPRESSTAQHGIAIPSAVKRDIFGTKIDPARPPRGAAG